ATDTLGAAANAAPGTAATPTFDGPAAELVWPASLEPGVAWAQVAAARGGHLPAAAARAAADAAAGPGLAARPADVHDAAVPGGLEGPAAEQPRPWPGGAGAATGGDARRRVDEALLELQTERGRQQELTKQVSDLDRRLRDGLASMSEAVSRHRRGEEGANG
ncbi:unnamed protein product, partial [Prorocentrum cordatum]